MTPSVILQKNIHNHCSVSFKRCFTVSSATRDHVHRNRRNSIEFYSPGS